VGRFDVFRHPDPRRRKTVPFLLSIQSDTLSFLETRVVVPLVIEQTFGARIPFLHPLLEVDGSSVVLAVNELVAVETSLLGGVIANLSRDASTIVSALDYLISGY
jgi:toxin CcdB